MLSTRQQHCLRGIGITTWVSRSSVAPAADELSPIEPTPPQFDPISPPAPAPLPQQQLNEAAATTITEYELNDWPAIQSAIEACQNCVLGNSCSRKVPGKGNQQADVMFIGEAPGHEEDLQGKPFVGRAGQLLDRMLQAIEIDPQSVYISNILKCRPPNNRDPQRQEIEACAPFLKAQISLIKPKIIVSVGRISAQNLLQDQSPVGRLRGQLHTLPHTDIPLLVTYHPAYLLRNPVEKAKVWQDLKTLRRLLDHA